MLFPNYNSKEKADDKWFNELLEDSMAKREARKQLYESVMTLEDLEELAAKQQEQQFMKQSGPKVAAFRMQGEYGAKKFIKP
eukprot:Awhi_evm1s12766